MFKTVIFDLGGVYFTNGTRKAVDVIAVRYDLAPAAVEDILNGDLGEQYRAGKLSGEQFWQRAKGCWNLEAGTEDLSRQWNSSYRPNWGTVGLVERLRNSGYELLYLSDNTVERVAYLEQKYNFLQKFDDGIFSHIVKCKKPDPKIYKLLLDQTSQPATACVYIDDKPEYLVPAKQLGMEVIAFENAAQLELRLKELALLANES